MDTVLDRRRWALPTLLALMRIQVTIGQKIRSGKKYMEMHFLLEVKYFLQALNSKMNRHHE
ncbi:MAG: hypothetical protein EA001_07570 [Oscillatoriales cyanobacterium]|nr:MAG: hypothetical protein EA001_07570 [Oscillatoriales cyanobacterium]